jgi:hypothetical protein
MSHLEEDIGSSGILMPRGEQESVRALERRGGRCWHEGESGRQAKRKCRERSNEGNTGEFGALV